MATVSIFAQIAESDNELRLTPDDFTGTWAVEYGQPGKPIVVIGELARDELDGLMRALLAELAPALLTVQLDDELSDAEDLEHPAPFVDVPLDLDVRP